MEKLAKPGAPALQGPYRPAVVGAIAAQLKQLPRGALLLFLSALSGTLNTADQTTIADLDVATARFLAELTPAEKANVLYRLTPNVEKAHREIVQNFTELYRQQERGEPAWDPTRTGG